MKVTVARNDLHEALALASSAVASRAAHPVLTSIRLDASQGALNLLGCDSEMWSSASLAASIEIEGSICVQHKLFSEIVSALEPGTVSLELTGTQVTLQSGQSEWKMLALPSEEFPTPPVVEPRSSLRLAYGELTKAIEGVIHACSSDANRAVLNGVLFQYDGETLTLVATDTHRLAVQRIHREGIGSVITAIVPQKALKAIKLLSLTGEDFITVTFDDTRLSVDVGHSQIISQLLTGSYPNWERVVPSEFTRSWMINREEFSSSVKRAMILAKDSAYRVRFRGAGDKVVISSRSEDKGEAKEEVQVVSRNGDMEIAFNGKYLEEALNSMSGEGVLAEMTEPSRPALIRSTDNGDDHFCVVMPMAIG
jgi:DNA polymerase-3 subunit beta